MNHLIDPIDQLKFGLDFAQMDLSSADLRAVSDGLNDFFAGMRGAVRGKPVPIAALAEAQGETNKLFRSLVKSGVFVGPVLQLQPTVMRPGLLSSSRWGAQVVSGMNGSLRDRVLYRMIELVQELGVEKLRECPAPECRRLFFKITQKRFCSSQCQKRIWAREKAAADRAADDAFTKSKRRPHGKTTRQR